MGQEPNRVSYRRRQNPFISSSPSAGSETLSKKSEDRSLKGSQRPNSNSLECHSADCSTRALEHMRPSKRKKGIVQSLYNIQFWIRSSDRREMITETP